MTINGPTGMINVSSLLFSEINVNAATIPINPTQTQDLLDLLTALKDRSTAFINNPGVESRQDLQQTIIQFYDFLSDYDSFPYKSVSYAQYLQLELNSLLQQIEPFNGLPILEGKIPQLLQQLYSALEAFIGELVLDEATYNIFTQLITSSISDTASQPITAAIPLSLDQPQVLLNFFTALQQETSAFCNDPTSANNQNLQNLLLQFYTFFNDFQVPGYTQYAKFLSLQAIITLNETSPCLGKIIPVLQQFYGELANFIERLIMPEDAYQTLTNLLSQSVVASTVCSVTGVVPITPTQIQDLLDLLTALRDRATAFINNPNTTNKQALQQHVMQFYDFLSDYDSFPYEFVAYVQYLQLELSSLLQQTELFNKLPIQEGRIPQILQQLYSALETFIEQLLLDTATFNTFTQLLTSSITYTASQTVTAAISIPPDQPQVLLNFFTALHQDTTAFFNNPTPENNQDLQNLFLQLYVFFRDFQVPGYTQYAKFLSLQAILALNQTPPCLGKIIQILQQFYAELANFIERLIMPESSYQTLTNLLSQSVFVSTACSVTGATGPTGAAGATGAIGATG
ncbi:collagen-like repeat preface domain-containing protein, partial [Bacillus wiedmannii]